MWVFNKIFFKLYQRVGTSAIFIGIITLQNYDSEELIYSLDELDNEEYSFIPTTLDAYLEFKLLQDAGDITKYDDLQTENIRC
jgi:hypothetical protein